MFYALGDFNINIEKSNRTNAAIEYLNNILSNRTLPIITIPTTVTSSFSIIIDHIIESLLVDWKLTVLSFFLHGSLTRYRYQSLSFCLHWLHHRLFAISHRLF